MKPLLLITLLFVFALADQAQTRPAARSQPAVVGQSRRVKNSETATNRSVAVAQSLPVRRVILYSNGVAYIERRGSVSGHAEINLSFKQSQVDDVLKSMVVLDLGQGRIGAVSYNS